ncbi:CDP-archaeol synthase [Candidatus Woesearchaeota archaeon]|nr:CDP-archaeol synthase [Candidatus Woesearchaeota archaeon]
MNSFIINIIYLLLPAALANMTPVLVKKYFKFLAYPVDFNKKLFGNRIFGSHKTFRGFLFGILSSILIVIFQAYLYRFDFFQNISLLEYNKINPIIFGFLFGFGVLFGDLIGSFIKRRLKISPGKSLLILDQINAVIGIAVFVFPFYLKSLEILIWITFVWLIGHFIIRYTGFLFGLNKEKL